MPIRASERARYPKDWKSISLRIRERDGQRCACDGRCGSTHWTEDGKAGLCSAPNGKLIIRQRHEPEEYEVHDPCGGCAGGDPDCARAVRIVLTVAHLDHVPENCADDNLLSMCQRCHLKYDSYQHSRNAWNTRRAGKAHRDLFDTPNESDSTTSDA
jgi:hypothetical protein